MTALDRTRCPALAEVAQDAATLGADESRAMLSALLDCALTFGAEASDGDWGAITLVFGSEQRRVSVGVTRGDDGGYTLLLEETNEAADARFAAGVKAWVGADTWRVCDEHYREGSHTGLRAFLLSMNGDLALLAKEVEETAVA